MSKVLSKSGIVVLYVALFQLLLTSPAAAMPFQIEGVGGGNARLYVVHGGANVSAPFGGELGVVNLTTGSYTTIGTPVPGASLTGLAYSANQLYVSTSNHSLAILNLAGGLISETPFSGGGFDSAAGDRVTDLAASRTGNLYASTWIGGVNTLCSVEPSNAELTVIGPLPDNGGGFHSLAFLFGRLYSHQTNAPGTFDEVSLTTGASVNAIPGGVPGARWDLQATRTTVGCMPQNVVRAMTADWVRESTWSIPVPERRTCCSILMTADEFRTSNLFLFPISIGATCLWSTAVPMWKRLLAANWESLTLKQACICRWEHPFRERA